MAFSLLRTALHLVSSCIMAYGFFSLEELGMNEVIQRQKGGHFQYLTIQGLALAWATMTCGLIHDICPSLKSVRRLKRVLLMMSLPLTFVISSIYWSLILFFPKLILLAAPPDSTSIPTGLPEFYYIPLRIDLSLHAVPLLAAFIDFMFFESKFTKVESRFIGPIIAFLFAGWYGWWVEYCATYNKTFPYPFLTDNPLDIRLRIYAGATVIALGAFWSLNAVHR